jgi:2-(1,2-epoxy-1,2-dihydrophenyl)acetyl-CoA isomerase
MSDSIVFEKIGQVAIISLNRPEVFNSVNREMALELQSRLDECQEDEDIRCVTLTGKGKAFCAGQDLKEAIDPDGPGLPQIVWEHYNPIISRLRNLEKPVVAAVNGVAAGAGANIALACDICIATEGASFIQAFSKIGLIPDSAGTFFLPRLVGMARASALTMLGDKISAAEAVKMGLIYAAVPDEAYETEVAKLTQRLAAMPTRGLWLTKKALNSSWSNDLDAQLELEALLQSEAGTTYDYDEGVRAFLEKRKPEFRGN